jgi:hypothetical protein
MAQHQSPTRQHSDPAGAQVTPSRDPMRRCRHQAVLEDTVPDGAMLNSAAPGWRSQRRVCPVCDCALELRFLHPTAGGCLLWVEERWLAGRTWAYRRADDRWDASV